MPHISVEATAQARKGYQAPDLVLGENNWFRPAVYTELDGFDLKQRIDELHGPKVEIGGPTYRYNILGDVELPSDMVVTNYYDPRHPELPVVDAAELPYANESVGALFSSGLPFMDRTNSGNEFNLRHAFLLEAKRCLEPGGVLVGQSGEEDEVLYALGLGFTPVRLLEIEGSYSQTGAFTRWDYVMVNTPPIAGLSYKVEALANQMPTQLANAADGLVVESTPS